jgi:hypothetical protein
VAARPRGGDPLRLAPPRDDRVRRPHRERQLGLAREPDLPSASVLKAMLLVAYLDLPSVRARVLGSGDRALLAPMIRRSDNAAAGRVLGIVGAGRLSALARRAACGASSR